MLKPLLLGHRGARRYAPENTLAAFDLALSHGCDGFEFDVRLTADGRAVVCHDPRIARLDVARSKYETLALVRRVASPLALHSAYDGAGTLAQMATALPCLEDVLSRFRERAFLYIELKVPGLEDAVVNVLRQYPPTKGYVVASFSSEVLVALYGRDKDIPLGYICDNPLDLAKWPRLPISALMPHYSLATPTLVRSAHNAGLQVMTWTVNRQAQMRTLVESGVDAIVSDDTDRLARTFGRNAA